MQLTLEQEQFLEKYLSLPNDILKRRNDNDELLLRTLEFCLSNLFKYKESPEAIMEAIERYTKRINQIKAEIQLREYIIQNYIG